MLERDFFQCEDLKNSRWNVRAIKHSNSQCIELLFDSISPAVKQELTEVKKMEMHRIYRVRPDHPAIDAVCMTRDKSDDVYLILMQISLSKYDDHRSKYYNIY